MLLPSLKVEPQQPSSSLIAYPTAYAVIYVLKAKCDACNTETKTNEKTIFRVKRSILLECSFIYLTHFQHKNNNNNNMTGSSFLAFEEIRSIVADKSVTVGTRGR